MGVRCIITIETVAVDSKPNMKISIKDLMELGVNC